METSDLTDERLAELEAMAKAEQKRAARARGEDVPMTRDELEKALAFFAHETDTALALIAEVRRLRTKEKAHQTLLREGTDAASRAATLEFELKAVKGALDLTEELLDRERAKVEKLKVAVSDLEDAAIDFLHKGLSRDDFQAEIERARAALAETETRDA